MSGLLQKFSLVFFVFFAAPLAVRAAVDWRQSMAERWATADWSSTGALPRPSADSPAMVRVYAARTGRWRGIFAVHTWIVIKPPGDAPYERYDKIGWGSPIRRDIHAPDARWYGHDPEVVYAADGALAEDFVPRIRAAIRDYAFRKQGDYRIWPGPNSNSFVAAVLAAIPEAGIAMPALAIGKDYPVDGRWVGLTPSRTGVRVTLGGYAGLTIGWVEGVELNLLGAVAGLDVRRPALKLPGFGRIGI